MKKTPYVVLALLITASLVISGCGSKSGPSAPSQSPGPTASSPTAAAPTSTPAPPEPIKITIWHGWLGDYLASVEQLFRNYEASHSDVQIQLVSVPDMNNRLISDIPAGANVDIIAFGMEWIGRLAEAGVIAPLNDKGVTADFLAQNHIRPAVDAMMYDAKVWGLPEAVECLTWIYNRALISESDIPANTDELLLKAQEWNAAHSGQYFFVYPAQNDVYFSAPWWYAAGAYMVNEDGSVGLNISEGLRAAQFVAQLTAIMPEQIDYISATTLFQQGNAAIIQNGPWYLPELEAAGIDYGLAFIPEFDATGQKGKPFLSGKALMLTPNSAHPDVALDVMKYFTSAESQTFLSERNGTIPTNLGALNSPAVQAMTAVEHFGQQAALGTAMPTTPYMSALWDPLAQALNAIWTGTSTPEQAIQDAQTQAEQGIAGMRR